MAFSIVICPRSPTLLGIPTDLYGSYLDGEV
jgi:hypothetical protein